MGPIAAPGAPSRRSISVLSILDEFSHACLAPELALTPASPGDVDEIAEADLLLAETAWNGNGGQWVYAFSNFGKSEALPELLAAAKRSEVPRVLWNKEDPASFDLFLPAAREFDHVVTTDVECVRRYRSELGHDRVHTMMFAAQQRSTILSVGHLCRPWIPASPEPGEDRSIPSAAVIWR